MARNGELQEFIESLTKDERSAILYAETCLVDSSGLMVGDRMNDADHAALTKFMDTGILAYGRIPMAYLERDRAQATHWVQFKQPAWELAQALRRRRAKQVSDRAKAIFADEKVQDKIKLAADNAETIQRKKDNGSYTQEELANLLYSADPHCIHHLDPTNWSGIRCKKCPGWFCH